MKKLFLLLLFCTGKLCAQTTMPDSSINLDVLKSPASAALNLLELSPSIIERPTDVNAFALSLQNSTRNFSALPNSYALELAPAYLLQKQLISLNKSNSSHFKDVFWQSLALSIGYTHLGPEGSEEVDSLRTSKLGLGVRFSLIRPKFSKATETVYTALINAQKQMLANLEAALGKDSLNVRSDSIRSEIKKLAGSEPDAIARNRKRLRLLKQLQQNDSTLLARNQLATVSTSAFNDAKKIASDFKIERKGAFLDLNTGIVLDFPDDRFNNSRVSRGGAWLTGGYENGSQGFTFLAIARYLYQPSQIFADDKAIIHSREISTFDAGFRMLIAAANGRFALSSEGIYRSVLNKDVLKPSWRVAFNAEYDIGKNQKLTLALGRNFDGVLIKGGNLIAALNFISSFGSARKITN